MDMPLNEAQLKALFKDSLAELLVEKPGLFQPLLGEVLEEVGLGRAIQEGLAGDYVSEQAIQALLNPSSG